MMQQVATTKSEVAAFASGAQSNSDGNAGANEQFGKLLYDQQSFQSTEKQLPTKTESMVNPSAKKPDEEITEKVEDTDLAANADEKRISANQVPSEKTAEQATSSKDIASNMDKPTPKESTKHHLEKEKPSATQTAGSESKLDVLDPKTGFELDSPRVTNTSTTAIDSDSETVAPAQWVSLVNNLQKLHRESQAYSHLDKASVRLPDISTEDLRLPNHIEEGLTSDDEIEAKLQDILAQGIRLTNEIVEWPIGAEGARAKLTDILTGDKVTIEAPLVEEDITEELPANIKTTLSVAIEQALSEAGQKNDSLVGAESLKQKAMDILLNDPEKLQKLGNEQNVEISEPQKTTVLGEMKTEEFSAVSEQPEASELIDMTSSENQSLLQILMTEQESLEPQAKSSSVLTQNDPLRQHYDIPKETLVTKVDTLQGVTDKVEPLPQTLAVETLSADLELLAKEAQVSASLPNAVTENKPAVASENTKVLNTLINLPESKLDKVLDNIAKRITDTSQATAVDPRISEQSVQQVVNAKASDMVALVDSTNKEVVAQLKTGLEEFKNQLAQGREPGIDLKALVAEAALKTADKGITGTPAVNPEQLVKTVSQALDFATSLNQAMDRHQEQTYSAMTREASQIQAEQSKQSQLNLFESKFDKAINITKPEGHQQLAEKVRWMVNTKNLIADIRLDPAELGSVQVKVAVSGESATVNFVVQSQQARDAVDTATPRLREMLAEKGIELGQSSVRQENGSQQQQDEAQNGNGQLANGQPQVDEEDILPEATMQQNIVNGALGGVDYFV